MAVELYTSDPGRAFHALGEIRVCLRGRTALSPRPSVEEANPRLRSLGLDAGATAVVGVRYYRGRSICRRPTLTAVGIAAVLTRDTR